LICRNEIGALGESRQSLISSPDEGMKIREALRMLNDDG